MNKKTNNELCNAFYDLVNNKDNYSLNLAHNAGRYKYVTIIKMDYKGVTYYTHAPASKWFKSLSACKSSITRIYP